MAGGGQLGDGLSTLSGLAGLIPGVGTALGMGINLVGGIASNMQQMQLQDEIDRKANQVKSNTPTGTLGLPNYGSGGQVPKTKMQRFLRGGGELREFVGPSHENGGIPVNSNGSVSSNPVAEVEGGETMRDGYVFSDQLIDPKTGKTYAEASKKIEKRYKNSSVDPLEEKAENLEYKTLKSSNDKMRQLADSFKQQFTQSMPTMAEGGELPIDPQGTNRIFTDMHYRLIDNAKKIADSKKWLEDFGYSGKDLDEALKSEFSKNPLPTNAEDDEFNKLALMSGKDMTAEQKDRYQQLLGERSDKRMQQEKALNSAIDIGLKVTGNKQQKGLNEPELKTFKSSTGESNGYYYSSRSPESFISNYEMSQRGGVFGQESLENEKKAAMNLYHDEDTVRRKSILDTLYERETGMTPPAKFDEATGYIGPKKISREDWEKEYFARYLTNPIKNQLEDATVVEKKRNGGYIPKKADGGPITPLELPALRSIGIGKTELIAPNTSYNTDYFPEVPAPQMPWNMNSPQTIPTTVTTGPTTNLSTTPIQPIQSKGITLPEPTINTQAGITPNSELPITPGVGKSGKIPLTLGDKIQMASNYTAPLFNLISAAQGYDKEPEQANKYAKEALGQMSQLRIRPDYNPIHAQANATRTAIEGGSSGMQRMAALLGLNNQVANTLGSASIQVANQNTALDQQYLNTMLGQGERDRAEAVRAKGTTDMNQAARFNMLSKAFEQLGTATGTVGSGFNSREEAMTTYNMMKNIFPDLTLVDFEKFMQSRGATNYQYTGGIKSYAPKTNG
jgi:hypothetical protein